MSATPPPAEPPRRGPRLLLRVLALLLGIAAALALAEVALRILDPFHIGEIREREAFSRDILTQDGPRLVLRPGARSRYLGHEVVIGSHGLRNRETPVDKPSGTFRVLVLGDSVAFGWGVAEADSFPRVLEDLLAAAGPPPGFQRVEVVNAAVPGVDLVANYVFLQERGLDYDPDLILLTVINNDVPGMLEHFGEAEARRVRLPAWTQHLDVFRLVQRQLDHWVGTGRPAEFWVGEAIDETGLAQLAMIFAGFRELIGEDRRLAVVDMLGQAGAEPFPAVVAACEANGFGHVEAFLPLADYRRDYAVSPIDDHPNARGHRAYAEAVFAWCRRELYE